MMNDEAKNRASMTGNQKFVLSLVGMLLASAALMRGAPAQPEGGAKSGEAPRLEVRSLDVVTIRNGRKVVIARLDEQGLRLYKADSIDPMVRVYANDYRAGFHINDEHLIGRERIGMDVDYRSGAAALRVSHKAVEDAANETTPFAYASPSAFTLLANPDGSAVLSLHDRIGGITWRPPKPGPGVQVVAKPKARPEILVTDEKYKTREVRTQ